MIDITRTEDANLVCSPKPRIPNEKMVGYMMDIKKLVPTKAHNPMVPGKMNATVVKTMLATA